MVISIASQKGGVGKTSTAISLASGLARKDKKVLLIDIDSQANSSKVLIREYQAIKKDDTIYTTILERKPLPIQQYLRQIAMEQGFCSRVAVLRQQPALRSYKSPWPIF